MAIFIQDPYSRSSGLSGLGQVVAGPRDGDSYPFPAWAVRGITSQADLKAYRVARAASRFMYKYIRENGSNPKAGLALYNLIEANKAAGSTESPSDELAGQAIGAWILYRLVQNRKDVIEDIASVQSAEDFEDAVIEQYYKFTPTVFFFKGTAAEMAGVAADRVLKNSFSIGAQNTSSLGAYADLALGATLAATLGYQNALDNQSSKLAAIAGLMETANFKSGPL